MNFPLCHTACLSTPPLRPTCPWRGRGQSHSQHSFLLTYRKEGSKHYEIRAETESECNAWMHALEHASFSKMLLQKEELEQKHLHLVQIVESEKTAKWQYTQQCEELTMEIKKLRAEVRPTIDRSSLPCPLLPSHSLRHSCTHTCTPQHKRTAD